MQILFPKRFEDADSAKNYAPFKYADTLTGSARSTEYGAMLAKLSLEVRLIFPGEIELTTHEDEEKSNGR